jgi:carbamoylphosphate synthase large subunit
MSKACMFVRWFGRAGYKVILIETEKFWCSGTRFSKYVHKFYTVSDAIKFPKQYKQDILEICKRHNIDMFIPVCAPATEQLDSEITTELMRNGIKTLHAPSDKFESLNNKYLFSELCREMRLSVPEFHLMESDDDVYKLN